MLTLLLLPSCPVFGAAVTKEVCIATTEIFPDVHARNKYPSYKFNDLSNGETIGYVGLLFIDHENETITFRSIKSSFSEFATQFKCIELANQSAYSK